MNWRDVEDMLRKKLKAQHEPQKKHDFWYVHCGDVYVGRVKDSRDDGEVRNNERGGIADSLKINEHTLRELVACNITREEFCAEVTGQKPPPPAAPSPPAP